ncbi:unnamed protein product [Zymoseptoria tritici ST99CH_1A5]|uniref:Uncharacterized protein n=2 Tax=Zymoseptoria tritici TaxID=1047171 RepID=A0A2H1GSW5_ZYMTR|nr:unnamed protein product [Zymoseptoria tritici ST99CH_1E4]SMY26719.1 unnamed protein product [Zymoseptoria tritici ST99CH_1A5]
MQMESDTSTGTGAIGEAEVREPRQICLFSEIIHMQVSSTPPHRANSAGQAPKSHLTRPSEVKILGSMQDRLQALARSGAVHAVFAFRAEGPKARSNFLAMPWKMHPNLTESLILSFYQCL